MDVVRKGGGRADANLVDHIDITSPSTKVQKQQVKSFPDLVLDISSSNSSFSHGIGTGNSFPALTAS
jgi:hypothetical protein